MIWPQSFSGVPILSKADMESIADSKMKEFHTIAESDDPSFSVWKFATRFLKKQVRFDWLSNNGSILGLSVFTNGTRLPFYIPEENNLDWRIVDENTILLDRTLEQSMVVSIHRPRFVLMHECAHQILHANYYKSQALKTNPMAAAYSIQKSSESENHARDKKKSWEDLDWIEWQANYLAAALLMPKFMIDYVHQESMALITYRDKVRLRYSEYLAFQSLIFETARYFQVSPFVVRLRLESIGFERMEDRSSPRIDPYALIPFTPKSKTQIKRENAEDNKIRRHQERMLGRNVDW